MFCADLVPFSAENRRVPFFSQWSFFSFARIRQAIAAHRNCQELDRKMELQRRLAGCHNDRTRRSDNALLMRWITYHADAFGLAYELMQARLEEADVRLFLANFWAIELALCRRRHVPARAWHTQYCKRLCKIIRNDQALFRNIQDFRELPRARRRFVIDTLHRQLLDA